MKWFKGRKKENKRQFCPKCNHPMQDGKHLDLELKGYFGNRKTTIRVKHNDFCDCREGEE